MVGWYDCAVLHDVVWINVVLVTREVENQSIYQKSQPTLPG